MQTAKDRRQRGTPGDFLINNQERQFSKERTKRQMNNLFDCKIEDYAEDRGTPSDNAYLAAKRTNRPVLEVDSVTSKNQFWKQDWADQRNTYFRKIRKCGHCCESAKHEQTWDVDMGKWVKSKHWDIRRIRRTCSARCHIDSQGRPRARTPANSKEQFVYCSML